MRKKIKYTDEPIGPVKVEADFLPSPEDMAFKKESTKGTLSLSKSSIEFSGKNLSGADRYGKK
jgi:hypothetical protein